MMTDRADTLNLNLSKARPESSDVQMTNRSFRNLKSFAGFFLRGASLGVRGFFAGLANAGLKRATGFILQPVENWSRYPEFFAVMDLFPPVNEHSKLLDIGSPKMFSLLLAQKTGAHVWLTDIWNVAILEIKGLLSSLQLPLQQRLTAQSADATNLKEFEAGFFDGVYSVSVLEHIEREDGVSVSLGEFSRVIRQDGFCVVSLPVKPQREDEFLAKDVYANKKTDSGKVFFSHYYDARWLKEIAAGAADRGLELECARLMEWNENWWLLRMWKKVPQKLRGLLGVVNLSLAPWTFVLFPEVRSLDALRIEREGVIVMRFRKTNR
jgi:SAM-dependent methyltransferase